MTPSVPTSDVPCTAAKRFHHYINVGEGLNEEVISRWIGEFAPRFRMPVLDELTRKYTSNLFERTALIAIQHLLGSFVPLVESLMRLGLEPRRMIVGGKPYSSNPLVVRVLEAFGVSVVDPLDSSVFRWDDTELCVAGVCDDVLERFFKRVDVDRIDTLLVIDDGGMLIRRARVLLGLGVRLVVIEQTTSGTRDLHQFVQFPESRERGVLGILVAKFLRKRRDEPSVIARACVSRVEDRLRDSGCSLGEVDVIVVGFGVIGRAVAHTLKALDVRVSGVDLSQRRVGAMKRIGVSSIEKCGISDEALRFRSKMLVVGATGRVGMSAAVVDDLIRLGGGRVIFLASVASSDYEFASARLTRSRLRVVDGWRRMAEVCGDNFVSTHADYVGDYCDTRVVLLNGGHPVNFDGEIEHLRTSEIEPTRALMLAAACVGVEMDGEVGVSKVVNKKVQRLVDMAVRYVYQGRWIQGKLFDDSR